jgi:hypothetical protein
MVPSNARIFLPLAPVSSPRITCNSRPGAISSPQFSLRLRSKAVVAPPHQRAPPPASAHHLAACLHYLALRACARACSLVPGQACKLRRCPSPLTQCKRWHAWRAHQLRDREEVRVE